MVKRPKKDGLKIAVLRQGQCWIESQETGRLAQIAKWLMHQRNHKWIFGVILFYCFFAFGCSAPARYRDIPIGTTSEAVLALLGKPDSVKRSKKLAPTVEYFGPKPSDAYLDLPEGAPIEIWSYRHFRETRSYIFSLEEQIPRLVDTGYYHPDIVY